MLARSTRCNGLAGSRKTLRSALEFRLQLQRAVSMNKRRFFDSGGGAGRRLDLDLTYVCDRLIAMAIPCVEGAVYRNDIREVPGLQSCRVVIDMDTFVEIRSLSLKYHVGFAGRRQNSTASDTHAQE